MDGGTGGFSLVPVSYTHLDVYKRQHNFWLKDMVDIMTFMKKIPTIYLFTVTIFKIEPMYLELSPKVTTAIPKVTEMVLELVNEIRKK